MSNIIYIVAGSRSLGSGAIADNGGLYANVGMTLGRDVIDRLSDPDYKKKQLGGHAIVIAEYSVGLIKDHDVHRHLKLHPSVVWDRSSNNTEEYLFIDDIGDGEEAKRIIEEIIINYLVPSFITEKYHNVKQEYHKAVTAAKNEKTKRIAIENSDPQLILDGEINVLRQDHEDRMIYINKEYEQMTATYRNEMLEEKRVANRRSVLTGVLSVVCFLGLITDTANIYLDHGLHTHIDNYQITRIDKAVHDSELTKLKRRNLEQMQEIRIYKNTLSQKDDQTSITKTENARKVCMMASKCVYDKKNDNKLTCSVHKGADRYSCTYTVERRIIRKFGGITCEDDTVKLHSGKIHNCGLTYKITSFKAN